MLRILLLLFVSACASRTPPQATAADAERANVALADLQEGRTLLVGKCGGCHKTPLPNEYAAAEWPRHMNEMAPKAKLDDRQRSLIEQYVLAMSTQP